MINVGSSKEIKIKDLAKIIKDIVGYKGNLKFNSEMPDGNPRKLLDSSKINNLGWSPKTKLRKGLEKTYNWYKGN